MWQERPCPPKVNLGFHDGLDLPVCGVDSLNVHTKFKDAQQVGYTF